MILLQRKDAKGDQTQIIVSYLYNTNMVRTVVDEEEVFKGSGFSVLARIQASLSHSLVNTENVSFAILEPCRFD